MFNKPIKTDSEGNIVMAKLTDHTKRKLMKEREDEFIPVSADIFQMCELAGHPEYFTPLRNRIFREMETNEALQNHVMVDLFDLDVMRLPESGIAMLYEILTSYFDEKDVIALRQYMHNQNECRHYNYSIDQSIKAARTPVLKQWVKGWNKMVEENKLNQEAANVLKNKVEQEIKRRRHIFG